MLPCGVGRVRQRSDSDGACGWSGRGRVGLVLRPAGMYLLHLLGALKIDPPGSTRHWCCLSPKSSAGDMKRGAL